jgi:succinyl-diaminopimelate desuccinylase
LSDHAAAVVDHDIADLFGLTAALCAVPSVSGDESVLAGAVEDRVRNRAVALTVDRIANNVVARTNMGRPRRIVLGGHLDTVPVNGNAVPRFEGDVLHGLGSADMKGGLAVMLALAELASEREAAHDLTFVWYEGEEVADEHNGLRHLFEVAPELLAGDLAILLEPTSGWVEAGCQGTMHARATVRGQRAHTARPWMGSNAIHTMSELLDRVVAY